MDYTLPEWDYTKAELIEEVRMWGVKRYLYKLPDAMQIHGTDSPIYFYHYEPVACELLKQKRSLVISYPILGGKMEITNGKSKFKDPASHFGAWFCATALQRNGIVVATNNQLIFQAGFTPQDVYLELQNVVYNHIQVHDFLINSGKFPKVNTTKFHHFGISLGALTAVAVAGITGRYKSLTAIMGGAPLSKVIAYSREKSVKDYFELAMINLHKTREELIADMDETFAEVDTYNAAQNIETDKVFLVLALFDDSVPNNILRPNEPKTGYILKEQLGDPKTDYYPTTHYIMVGMVLFWLPKMIKNITNHDKR